MLSNSRKLVVSSVTDSVSLAARLSRHCYFMENVEILSCWLLEVRERSTNVTSSEITAARK